MKNLSLPICLIVAFGFLMGSCGKPTESMEDFIKRTCDKKSYDCDCYAKQVQKHFKTEDAFTEWKESGVEDYPDELIKLRGECSKDEDFDF